MATPNLIYKVAPFSLWQSAEAAGVFTGAPVDLADGFIHFSTAGQLRETLARHFAGQGDLMLAAVNAAELGDALRWEVSRGGDLFPHLYVPLDLKAVAWTTPIAVAADGSVDLPEALR